MNHLYLTVRFGRGLHGLNSFAGGRICHGQASPYLAMIPGGLFWLRTNLSYSVWHGECTL